ncbi:membrane fusion protein, Cu(I)/Ag(I) efflux system [Nitrosospira sp. Nsp18]|uniref:efflux RND transporter periplasmic adaptor subunit n=1 Tax=Nitrosospira sp. Nsp18 TaxID=1855334 RepID=UPI000885B97C|nr:efflux RND transporter periplasmic adaptor subunit [Nitrosospira sp. Nsp18]SDA15294.1 membrane fusion protein, Cu(I)/Ag(I) efflux system [Nitrosospira sp. Nsp18]
MKTITRLIVVIALIAAALAGGYWWGSGKSATSTVEPQKSEASTHKPKILYYRNPMGHPDTSPVPKKDSMGMDYLPVYEGEESPSGNSAVKISTEKIQKLGVRTEIVALRELTRTVRAVATVQADERRLYTVAPKFEGWIQRLYVNTTGQAVKKGEALMDVYSPELITAQHEYLIARKGMQSVEGSGPEVRAGMRRLSENALQRLRNWDISDSDLQTLQEEGRIKRFITLRSPASGTVIEKSAIQGNRFTPGEVLYQITDLSKVWMLADVFEQDLGLVQRGQGVTITLDAYPDKVFNGKVTFIYPTVTPETRTAKIRIELPNAQGLLKPAMYGRVEFASSRSKNKVLAVPDSAVLDSGIRRLVLVDLGEGRFEPRALKLGIRADGYAEVLGGLKAGETVVVSANFLIDAESNLKAALGGFGHHPGSTSGENGQTTPRAPMTTRGAAPGPASHHGVGNITEMDWTHATVTIAHDAIASLNWPAMTMDFRVRDPSLLRPLKPGQKVNFEIAEESAGEYVIVRIQPPNASPTASDQRGH